MEEKNPKRLWPAPRGVIWELQNGFWVELWRYTEDHHSRTSLPGPESFPRKKWEVSLIDNDKEDGSDSSRLSSTYTSVLLHSRE